MKFDHEQEKVQKVVVGHKMDDERVKELAGKMGTEPHKVFGGSKKSHIMEWVHNHADDADALMALALVLTAGVEAIVTMAMIEKKSREHMAQMEIDPRMPEEMKEAIRQAKKLEAVTSNTEVEPQTEEVDDEFEKLKRKYQ